MATAQEIWHMADLRCKIDGEDHYPDSEYFTASSDEEALEIAKGMAEDGGKPVPCELDYLIRVDSSEETFPEIGQPIYY